MNNHIWFTSGPWPLYVSSPAVFYLSKGAVLAVRRHINQRIDGVERTFKYKKVYSGTVIFIV